MLPVLGVSAFSLLGIAVWMLQRSLHTEPALLKFGRVSLFPSSLDGLAASANYVSAVAAHRPFALLLVFSLAYCLKQAFSVPGSVILNVFAGIAFGRWLGIALTTGLTAAGASLAYLLSTEFGSAVLSRCGLEARILPLRLRVGAAQKRGTLFFYLTALRMTTVFPQWLLNLASPHCGVPLSLFAVCTLLGTLPYNAITVNAGASVASAVHDGQLDWSNIVSGKTVAMLLLFAAVCALPGLFMKRLEGRLAGHAHSHASPMASGSPR
jgi:uncharacterized membrane protein YdjX (TVP38/TMEM64 family)